MPAVGGSDALCFGEKGYLWLELQAEGRMTHGAQVHKGVNAINKLMAVADKINKELPCLPFTLPHPVEQALQNAAGSLPPQDLAMLRRHSQRLAKLLVAWSSVFGFVSVLLIIGDGVPQGFDERFLPDDVVPDRAVVCRALGPASRCGWVGGGAHQTGNQPRTVQARWTWAWIASGDNVPSTTR